MTLLPEQSAAWIEICAVADIPVLGSRVVRRARGPDIAIFRNTEDRVFALLDRCPHKGGPLSQGIVFGERVACPLHNWTIDLTTGCASAPDEGCTLSFETRVEDGRVFLESRALTESTPKVPPLVKSAHIDPAPTNTAADMPATS
jgi:nitrite reductase (NADH) small subunit